MPGRPAFWRSGSWRRARGDRPEPRFGCRACGRRDLPFLPAPVRRSPAWGSRPRRHGSYGRTRWNWARWWGRLEPVGARGAFTGAAAGGPCRCVAGRRRGDRLRGLRRRRAESDGSRQAAAGRVLRAAGPASESAAATPPPARPGLPRASACWLPTSPGCGAASRGCAPGRAARMACRAGPPSRPARCSCRRYFPVCLPAARATCTGLRVAHAHAHLLVPGARQPILTLKTVATRPDRPGGGRAGGGARHPPLPPVCVRCGPVSTWHGRGGAFTVVALLARLARALLDPDAHDPRRFRATGTGFVRRSRRPVGRSGDQPRPSAACLAMISARCGCSSTPRPTPSNRPIATTTATYGICPTRPTTP